MDSLWADVGYGVGEKWGGGGGEEGLNKGNISSYNYRFSFSFYTELFFEYRSASGLVPFGRSVIINILIVLLITKWKCKSLESHYSSPPFCSDALCETKTDSFCLERMIILVCCSHG